MLNRARRALRELDVRKGHIITFAEFVNLNDTFPTIFFPVFKLQAALRNKVRK